MSTERPLHLDVGLPSGSSAWGSSSSDAQTAPGQRQDLQQDSQRLHDLIAKDKSTATQSGQAQAAINSEVKSPFDLFRPCSLATPSTASQAPSSQHPTNQGLDDVLQQMASRLLVSDGSQGRRAVQLQLDDPELPGVELQIFETEGRLTALFTCASENSRQKLCSQSAWLAEQMALKLQRSTCVQVQTDDPAAPCLEQTIFDTI